MTLLILFSLAGAWMFAAVATFVLLAWAHRHAPIVDGFDEELADLLRRADEARGLARRVAL